MANGRLRLVPHLVVLVLSVLLTLGVLKYRGVVAGSAGAEGPSTLDRIVATKTLRFGIPIGDLPVADARGAVEGDSGRQRRHETATTTTAAAAAAAPAAATAAVIAAAAVVEPPLEVSSPLPVAGAAPPAVLAAAVVATALVAAAVVLAAVVGRMVARTFAAADDSTVEFDRTGDRVVAVRLHCKTRNDDHGSDAHGPRPPGNCLHGALRVSVEMRQKPRALAYPESDLALA